MRGSVRRPLVLVLTYNLDPDEAWDRHHQYQVERGHLDNMQRMLCPVSPLDFLELEVDSRYVHNEARLEHLAHQPKKESTCNA